MLSTGRMLLWVHPMDKLPRHLRKRTLTTDPYGRTQEATEVRRLQTFFERGGIAPWPVVRRATKPGAKGGLTSRSSWITCGHMRVGNWWAGCQQAGSTSFRRRSVCIATTLFLINMAQMTTSTARDVHGRDECGSLLRPRGDRLTQQRRP